MSLSAQTPLLTGYALSVAPWAFETSLYTAQPGAWGGEAVWNNFFFGAAAAVTFDSNMFANKSRGYLRPTRPFGRLI